jgi:hypothetical protein
MEGHFDGLYCLIVVMARRHDLIFVIVDTLTKSAHFITFYQGLVFTRRFWTSFQEALETQLNFNTAYHSKIDEKTKMMNQILEYMLCICVMDQQKHWEEFLPLVEFAFNNNYQSTIKMAPFEFLYGRPCQMPLSWD